MIIADTGALVALLAPRQSAHAPVRNFLGSYRGKILIPSVVLGEVSHFLQKLVTPAVEARFLRSLSLGQNAVIDPVEADYLRAADLVEQYADFPLGTVDALIVAIAERLDVTTLLTLDRRHFGAIRPTHRASFEIVP